MSHQMSFDFPLESGFVPGRNVLSPRRRAVAAASAPSVLVAQLAFNSADDPAAAPAHIEIKLPVVVAERPAPRASIDSKADDGREWHASGWSARVVRSEDADGWAVEMRMDGEAEPALVASWSADSDGRSPRPLDQAAFNALLKTASGIRQRQEQQRHARLHKRLSVATRDARWDVSLTIVPDDYEPHALLAAFDENGELLAQEKVMPDFRLTEAVARAWIEGDFRRAERE